PRGSQSLLKAVQVYALLQGRDYVLPDDVKAMANPVLGHRLVLSQSLRSKENRSEAILDDVISQVPVPQEELSTHKGLIDYEHCMVYCHHVCDCYVAYLYLSPVGIGPHRL